MIDVEIIDPNILLMATNLDKDVSEKNIIDVYAEAGFGQGEIFLLLSAAKIIHNDRKIFVKPKAIFRRVKE